MKTSRAVQSPGRIVDNMFILYYIIIIIFKSIFDKQYILNRKQYCSTFIFYQSISLVTRVWTILILGLPYKHKLLSPKLHIPNRGQ